MTTIEVDAKEYLEWMEIHNYAVRTVECRRRYLGYFFAFAGAAGVTDAKEVTLDLLLGYQHAVVLPPQA